MQRLKLAQQKAKQAREAARQRMARQRMKGGLKRKLKVEARVLLAVERLSADELNARFEEVLAALQLPAAAAEQMRGFDVAKKRQVRCCLSPLPLAAPSPRPPPLSWWLSD